LKPRNWYWVQLDNGTIVPYRLNKVLPKSSAGQRVEMFVGSMIQTFSHSQIIGLAEMPSQTPVQSSKSGQTD
ncbi:MAG: hypothetical protein VX438_16420, partial [Planctomycetota bacterium]|nr:hypothetical protein [Planctomycetota bacterium]